MEDFVVEKISKYYDNETTYKIISGLKQERKTTFRVNYLKSNEESVIDELNKNNINFDKISLDTYNANFVNKNTAFIITKEYDSKLMELKIYKEGMIYMQSISSMIPALILNPKDCENILDMCAAPGSKTTMIESIACNKVNLTAIELHKDRFERLKYNVSLQNANAYCQNISALDLSDMLKFDKILLDAPCSGSGILNLQNDNYKKYFTSELINKCVATQKKLIKKAYNLLKKAGMLVYSTCSILNVENEDMVKYAESIGFTLSTNSKNVIKILPDDLYEGFFVATFIKN